MKISDLLSPADVLFDVRASNKRLLLQELAAKAATSLNLRVDQIAPYLLKREELGSTGVWWRRRHSARSTARFAATLWALGETEAADRIRRHRRAAGRYRVRAFVACECGGGATWCACPCRPDAKVFRNSRSVASCKRRFRTLFDDSDVMRLCRGPHIIIQSRHLRVGECEPHLA